MYPKYFDAMNISELKLNLIHKIMDMPESALRNVSNLIDSSASDWWSTLSKQEQEEIDQGLTEANSGKGVAHHDVMKRLKK